MNNIKRRFLYAFAVLALCGCAVGPDFEAPKYDAPKSWEGNGDAEAHLDKDRGISPEELSQWWKLFGDDQLVSLIERAFEGNPDLELAMAKIRQTRAGVGITQSGLFPTIDINADLTDTLDHYAGTMPIVQIGGHQQSFRTSMVSIDENAAMELILPTSAPPAFLLRRRSPEIISNTARCNSRL